ncbi:hypothetical protein HD806DRAFT_527628 [Xylariaceae sp. AK1471]|nr:hypothetical protein HD806DRAFT_527628 [Xylariaceae sp. AK1471]
MYLMCTGQRVLVEASPSDGEWGIGRRLDDCYMSTLKAGGFVFLGSEDTDTTNWEQNKLGEMLMIRDLQRGSRQMRLQKQRESK